MHYNFDKVINRKNVNSYKWDVNEGELPMWVADMDFETTSEIISAIQKRLDKGAFGYNIVPDSLFNAYISWWERRHQFTLKKEWLMFCTGAVPAISSIVRKVTRQGDKVVLMTPIYNIFYNSIINNNRHVLESPLKYADGSYSINYEDLEAKLADEKTSLMIFCNPHNPNGKVWTQDELKRIGQLCLKHHVLILSDEVHCDLVHPDAKYTPMASVSDTIAEITMTCLSPSKAFNIAGLQSAIISVPDTELYKLVNRAINTDEVAEPNTFAIEATQAAFNAGESWLEHLNSYLTQNRDFLATQLHRELPEIRIVSAQATYLAWLDCSAITRDTKELCDFIRKESGLILSDGAIFGGNGNLFIRWNYACPKSVLEDGIGRFTEAVQHFKEE